MGSPSEGSCGASATQGGVRRSDQEEHPRGTWKLGRIEQIHPSSDGQARALSVRMPSGRVLTKSLADLAPLELEDERKQTSPPGVSRSESLMNRVLAPDC